MKRKWQKKVTGVLLGAMLAGSAFGGANPVCAEEGADLEPMEISVALWGIQEGFDAANAVNDTIFNDLCEKFNITINPVSVTWNDYQEKNKVWAASGSLPDLFCDALATDNNALYQTWAKQGIIKEIPSDLSAYENLNTIMSMDSVQALAIDGKLYMIPRGGDPSAATTEASPMSRTIMYRKDWAAQAGYTEEPQTYEEFVEMIRAMMEQHPEASGISANSIHYLATLALDLMPEYVNENAWVCEGDQWIPVYASERVVPYIERMQSLYQEGILDPDFMTQKDGDAIAKFQSGYACVMLGGDFNALTFMEANTDVANISDAIGFITPFAAEDGNRYVFANTPYWSETYISAAVEDAKLERILMLLDYMYSHEYGSLLKNGIEGVDWEEKDGERVSLLGEETLSDKYPITSNLGWLASWFSGFDDSGDLVTPSNPIEAEYKGMFIQENADQMETCLAAPIDFDVFLMSNDEKTGIASLASEFVEKVDNLIISGEDAQTGWQSIIDEFNNKGLTEAIESVTAQAAEMGIGQ